MFTFRFTREIEKEQGSASSRSESKTQNIRAAPTNKFISATGLQRCYIDLLCLCVSPFGQHQHGARGPLTPAVRHVELLLQILAS
jgi:hypothetical protein